MLSAADAMLAESLLGRRPWEAEVDAIIAKQANFGRPPDDTDVLHNIKGDRIEHPAGTDRAGRPRVFDGGIGTADTLQKNPKLRDELRDRYRVRAIEMEAGGMQNAAWAAGRSLMVVRGICDYCDAKKSDLWQMYACAAAAGFTKMLVLGLPAEWF
jgi:nucleoside phosphorylase